MNLENSNTRSGIKISSYRARVEVKLKSDHIDSEGLTAKKALNDMGYKINEVTTANVYEIDLEADSLKEAEERTDEMCRKMLANPVKDDYKVEVEETG